MRHKLLQQLKREKYTTAHRIPALRSRQFIINALRFELETGVNTPKRIAMAYTRLHNMEYYAPQSRIAHRASCFLTGRSRGISGRYGVSRLQVKHLS